jgi:hypothetical protein
MEDVKLIAVGQILSYPEKEHLSTIYLLEFESGFMGYCETPVDRLVQVMTSPSDFRAVRYAQNLRPPTDAEAEQANSLYNDAMKIIHTSDRDTMLGIFNRTVAEYEEFKARAVWKAVWKLRWQPDIFHYPPYQSTTTL